MKVKKFTKAVMGVFLAVAVAVGAVQGSASAGDAKFSVSPMNQKIVLTAGETYYGTFKVTNPGDSDAPFNYTVSVKPFYVTDTNGEYNVTFENNGDYNQMVDWVKLDREGGLIQPNNTDEVRFSIDVPKDAPSGGQYAAITVKSVNDDAQENAINIQAKYEIAHILYAEVAGETRREGDITDISMAGFLFKPPITAGAKIKNNGNVHSEAVYKLQVFPLFSGEEVYTNEEDPDKNIILPGTTRYNTVSWDETPSLGIYKAIFTVEFEGLEKKTEKIVVVCPMWLLFVVLLVIFAIVFWLVARSRSRKKKNNR